MMMKKNLFEKIFKLGILYNEKIKINTFNPKIE